MRLLCTIQPAITKEDAITFSCYLASQGIENECQEVHEQNGLAYRIWIYDEDLVPKALELYTAYQHQPSDPKYKIAPSIDTTSDPVSVPPEAVSPPRRSLLSLAPYGPVTLMLIFAAIGLFIWSQFTRPHIKPVVLPGIVQAPFLSPLEQKLIFDDPLYFSLRDRLLTLYTPKQIEAKEQPSQEAQALFNTLAHTPVWVGFYDLVVTRLQQKPLSSLHEGPLMEDIRQGQVWRLVTPALLHFDFLHIFFNLLWLILLGNQIEYRLGSLRYGLLVMMLAVLPNVAQYLMSGPFFMGLSGIVCGLAGFIWARQTLTPWEGYLLHRFTLIFLALFVFGIFALQVFFFFLQVLGNIEFTIGIANTAHLVGGLVGYGCGRMRTLFAIHKKSSL